MTPHDSNGKDFFLLVSPSATICNYVYGLKRDLRKNLGHGFDSDSSKAHISLFQYQDRHNESRLYDLEEVIAMQSPFMVFVKGLCVFQHGANRTIYLDIVNKVPLCNLAEQLCKRKIVPHITIAKNLSPEDFLQAWRQVTNISQGFEFNCRAVTVLERDGKKWVPYTELSLTGSQKFNRNEYASLITDRHVS